MNQKWFYNPQIRLDNNGGAESAFYNSYAIYEL